MQEHEFAYFEGEVLDILGVTRGTFTQSIKPLMIEARYCRKDETKKKSPWVYDGRYMWQWKLYIATRKNLIKARVWNGKHPYSIRDFEEIVHGDAYEEYLPKLETK